MLNAIEGIRCYRPDVTFYVFPNVTELMRRKGVADYESFRAGQSCTRPESRFARDCISAYALAGETEKYVRFAYSGIDLAAIEDGMERFAQWAR